MLFEVTPRQTCDVVEGRWVLLGSLCHSTEGFWRKKTQYKLRLLLLILLLLFLLLLPLSRKMETFLQKLQDKFSLKMPSVAIISAHSHIYSTGTPATNELKTTKNNNRNTLLLCCCFFYPSQQAFFPPQFDNFINGIFYHPPSRRHQLHCCLINQTQHCLLRRKRVILQGDRKEELKKR